MDSRYHFFQGAIVCDRNAGVIDQPGLLKPTQKSNMLAVMDAAFGQVITNPDADNEVAGYNSPHRRQRFNYKARSVLQRTAILIGACIGVGCEKLRCEVAVCSMELDTVHAP